MLSFITSSSLWLHDQLSKIMIFIHAETLECTYCSYFPINYSPGFSGHTDCSTTLKVLTKTTKLRLYKTSHWSICCTRRNWKGWYCLALRSEGLFRVCMCTFHQCIQIWDWGSEKEQNSAGLFSVVPSERTRGNEHQIKYNKFHFNFFGVLKTLWG